MSNPAREDKIDGSCEVVAVLQKEGPLLGKEDFEPLIDCDLGLIRFDLAEVGIDSAVEHEAVVQDELGVETDVGFFSSLLELAKAATPGQRLPIDLWCWS